MKFRGESRKNKFYSSLILAIVAILVGGGEIAVSQDQPPPAETVPETERVFSANPWRTAVPLYTLIGHNTGVDSLVFSIDGKTLFSGGSENDGALRAWSVKSGKLIDQDKDVRAQQTDVMTLAVTPNGKMLISSGKDATVNLWMLIQEDEDDDEITFPKEFQTSFVEHRYEVLAVAISPDGQVLVSGALDGIRVWNIYPQRPIYQLTGIGNPVYALAFNPDGQLIASGDGDGKVQFWNIKRGTFVSEFFPHQEPITALTFTPDGKLLITASYDRTIKIWDLETGTLIHTLVGHTERVRAIALHPDGRTLATGSNDGIRIWDIVSGDFIKGYQGHRDWVTALAFSRDGRYLASGGLDSAVVIWDSDSAAVESPEESDESEDSEE